MRTPSSIPWPALSLAVALLGAAVAPAAAQAQLPPPPTKQRAPVARAAFPAADSLIQRLRRSRPPAAPLPAPSIRLAAAATVDEVEPNDSLSLAMLVTLGDTVAGVIDPANDVDFFAVDLQAGTVLDLDVDAQSLGSSLDSYVGLFDPDSVFLRANDDADGLDSRLIYVVPVTGRYLIGIVDYGLRGGPGYTYRLSVGALALDETEPNDDAAGATLIAMEDTVIAAVSGTDVDWFAVDVPAGTYVGVAALRVEYTVPLELTLYAPDAVTVLRQDTVYSTPELRYWSAAGGRHYVTARAAYGAEGLYGLVVRALPIGPGDPTSLVAGGFGYAFPAAAGLAGETYLMDLWNGRLVRVAADGTVGTLIEGFTTNAMAVDGYGDILANGWHPQTGFPAILRITRDGQQSVFAADSSTTFALAVGPDGDVWRAGCGPTTCQHLARFDPSGIKKSSMALNASPFAMAFSPGGVLHLLEYSRVLTVSGGTVQTVIDEPSTAFIGMAFDADGYLYLATADGIALYSPTYQVVNRPFATTNLGEGPLGLHFARDAAGVMTTRLLAVTFDPSVGPAGGGGLFAVNPDGVRAIGHAPQPRLLRLAGDLSAGTMGAPYADTLRVTDGTGPFTWQVASGQLPPGLTLAPATGVVSGVPGGEGTFIFTARAEGAGRFGAARFTLQVGAPTLTLTDIVSALLGVPGLMNEEEERFLDLQGNRNGHLDIGDVRAYLRAHGQLPASIAALLERKEDR